MINKNIKKYFFFLISKKNVREIINKNNSKGILLPAIIIEIKNKDNNKKKIKYKIFKFLIFKKIGNKKKEKIENLCKNEPAICSSPKGPDNLLGFP